MFLPFFYQLRDQGIPISLRYVLEFYQALEKGLAPDLDRLFILMRLIFVKKVEHFHTFEQAFASYFLGLEGDAIPRFSLQAWEDKDFSRWLEEELAKGTLSDDALEQLSLAELLQKFWDVAMNYLRKKGYEFIMVRGSTTVEQILEAISIKAGILGLDYAEKIFDSFDDPEGKMTWYLEQFLLKQKVVIIFDPFEENQDEKKAGAFKQERLKKFLWFSRDRLKLHESFLLFSTRYMLPGFDSPGMTRNIPGFSTPAKGFHRFFIQLL